MAKHRRRPDGRIIERAPGLAQLGQGMRARHCAMPAIEVTEIDVGYDIAERLRELKPDVAFNALHGPFGEDGTIQGVLEFLQHSLHAFGRAGLGAGHEQAPDQDHAQGGRHSGDRSRHRRPRRGGAQAHVMAPPYVVKPIADGSSFGVFIVKADQSASAAGNAARGLEWAARRDGRALHSRPRADLRGDGRRGARRHRDHHRPRLLQLRGEIRRRRLPARHSGANSTENLRQSAEDGAQGACCAWVPGRDADGLPLQRQGR